MVLASALSACSTERPAPTFAEAYCEKLDSCGRQLDWGPGRLLTLEECYEAAAVKWPTMSEPCVESVEAASCEELDATVHSACGI